MKLFDSPTLKALIATLPADADRQHAETVYLKRERQLHALRNRAAEIRTRCVEIAEALPDASAKQAKELHNERRDLMAEQNALPADLTVTSRLYAGALIDYLQTTERAIVAEQQPHRAHLEATQDQWRKEEYALTQQKPGQPAYDTQHAAFMALVRERQPHIDRLEDLNHLSELFRAFVSDALKTPESARRAGGVKLIEGRPTDTHVAAFVAQAGRTVA